MRPHRSETLCFESFELDLKSLELLRDGEPVALPPQPARLLALLARRSGELVTREEIREHIWGEQVVEFETGLHTAIRRIRRALGDESAQPRYVQTVPRRGYRFLPPVEWPAAPSETETERAARPMPRRPISQRPASRRAPRRWGLATAAGLLAALAVAGLVAARFLEPTKRNVAPAVVAAEVRLAVLPFEDLVRGGSEPHRAASLADELRTELTRVAAMDGGLEVIARNSSDRYPPSERSLARVRRELGVSHVLEGSFGDSSEGSVLAVQLVRVRDEVQVWSQRFPWAASAGPADSGADFVGEAARRIVAHLAPEADLSPLAGRGGAATAPPLAVRDALLEARYLLRPEARGDTSLALARLETVLEASPELAEARGLRAEGLRRRGRYDEAQAEARRALALDPGLALAHRVLGDVTLYGRLEPAAAGPEYRHAVSLAPEDPDILLAYAGWLLSMGRPKEALVPIRAALERDPVSPLAHGRVTWYLFYSRRFDEVDAQSRRSLELLPDLLSAVLCRLYLAVVRGDPVEAKAMIRRALELADEVDPLDELEGMEPSRAVSWFLRREAAVEDGEESPSLALRGRLYAMSGDRERSLDLLRRSLEAGEPRALLIDIDPRLDSVRDDPRFTELVARVEALRGAPKRG